MPERGTQILLVLRLDQYTDAGYFRNPIISINANSLGRDKRSRGMIWKDSIRGAAGRLLLVLCYLPSSRQSTGVLTIDETSCSTSDSNCVPASLVLHTEHQNCLLI